MISGLCRMGARRETGTVRVPSAAWEIGSSRQREEISASQWITKGKWCGQTTKAVEPKKEVFAFERMKTSWKRWGSAGLEKWESLNRTKEEGRCFKEGKRRIRPRREVWALGQQGPHPSHQQSDNPDAVIRSATPPCFFEPCPGANKNW